MANGNPVVLGNADTSTKQTAVNAATPGTQAGLRVENWSGTGIAAGSLQGVAMTAGSVGSSAIVAESFAGSGIVSTCVDTRDKPGISVAVRGTVAGGFGVAGINQRGQFPESGVAGSAALGAIGVDGTSRLGFGVRGITRSNAASGAGVMGIGSPGHGVIGIATRTATTPGVPPPFVPVSPLFAGLFFGNLQVQGNFTVTGNKAAVVKHPDGSHRQLYCVESPESWFEDFGTGKLSSGRAEVTLEDTFAKLVSTKDYHVFLTPEGDCNGLYVHRKGPNGFEVRELQKGNGAASFSWRIVARRRGATGKRLEVVELGLLPDQADATAPTPKSPSSRAEAALETTLTELASHGTSAKKAGKAAKKR